MVRSCQDDAVLACNLYGESVDLYARGFVKFPENVIRIWGDNGYGKMVCRRQGLLNQRLPALPETAERKGMHGMYYHVSFYDLQAANHITMTPVSLDLMSRELKAARDAGINDLIVVNVSNIRPHAMPASFVASFWERGEADPSSFLREYALTWFPSAPAAAARAFSEYSAAAPAYGNEEDEVAGEQFYCYALRALLGAWMKGETGAPVDSLRWFAEGGFAEQTAKVQALCHLAAQRYDELSARYAGVSSELKADRGLFDSTLGMYARLYSSLAKTLFLFCESSVLFAEGKYVEAFLRCGDATEESGRAETFLRSWERGIWRGFYANDCLTDVSQNAYLLKTLMEYIRTFGDAPEYFKWQRLLAYPEKDRKVVLLTNWEKHMTAWELYRAHKER